MNIANFENYCNSSGQFQGLGLRNVSQYAWPKKGKLIELPESFGLPSLTGETSFERNVQLKELGPTLWKNVDHEILANWIVKDWGGIKRNLPSKIQHYVKAIENNEPPTTLDGVATYSKILGLVDPTRYCIYDARVSISLTCIQLLENTSKGAFFPYLQSQNKTINNFKKLYPKDFFLSLGWDLVRTDDCYQTYNSLLLTLAKHHNIDRQYLIEMALFIDCEKLIAMVSKEI